MKKRAPARLPEAESEPFPGSTAHLVAELGRVDGLVREAARRARATSTAATKMRSLYVSDAEVDGLVDEPPGPPTFAEAAGDQGAAALDDRAQKSVALGIELRLQRLRASFDLDRFDVDALLLALLPEVDPRIGRLIGYLHDDLTRRRPSVDLALSLLCSSLEERLAARARFQLPSPLLRHGLLQVFTDSPAQRPPLLVHALKVDDRIIAYLHGSDALDPALSPHARPASSGVFLEDLGLFADPAQKLLRFLDAADGAADGPIVYLEGPHGAGHEALADALCGELEIPLLVVEGAGLVGAADEPLKALPSALCREARLRGAAMLLCGADALLDERRPTARAALIKALVDHPGLVFLAGKEPWEPTGSLAGRTFLRATLPRPDAVEQQRLFREAVGGEGALAGDVDLAALTGMFRLTPGRIRDAAATARDLTLYRHGGGPITAADVTTAFRLQHRQGLGALARRIESRATFGDLVVPRDREQVLREICAHVRHRARVYGAWGFERKLSLGKGLGVLFSGPPGTGKTMAAGVLAGELGLELYQVDLASVVSKYIGETEKHLARLFDDAEATGAILFFDEADALFGKRTEVKDAHDRHANVQTSYLLQRIDSYEGLVILASNLTQNMDEAFVRRLRFLVEFPFPGAAERRRIWEHLLPAEMPRAADVDLGYLARRFDVAGGHLRNMALAAAFLAAEAGADVAMSHLLHAARREYSKMGRVVDDGHFAAPIKGERARC
ncbi:MAG: ATP-binding protein [Byssovorax sp.]